MKSNLKLIGFISTVAFTIVFIRVSAHRTAINAVADYEEIVTRSVVWNSRSGFQREQVQPLVNALVALHEASAKVPSEAHMIAQQALDYAGTLGF
jgi:hypothetical protein